MPEIILTTLNARYAHAAVGLRYLFANLGELQSSAHIAEFTINDNVQEVAGKLLATQPKIIGIGVYIWNAVQVNHLLHILKKVSPETTVILGGPEVSYTPFRVDFSAADIIIQGEGELVFAQTCRALLDNKKLLNLAITGQQVIKASPPALEDIELPYQYYTDEDVAHRCIYVEASRGCPFKCEFCLSSMDNRVRPLFIDRFIDELELLWQRGVRNYKFVDRTFNLNIKVASRLLDFFLKKEPPYLAHFEVIPDHFPERLKSLIAQFPPASLQLEIGIQTLNNEISTNISRPLKLDAIENNVRWLSQHTQAHLHLDLIVGLPGESLQSFGKSLNKLCQWTSSEIQIGILKKLSGTALSRHDQQFGMVYSDIPPYDILQNNDITFTELQRMKRFARFWDLIYNNGNFIHTWKLLVLCSQSDSATHSSDTQLIKSNEEQRDIYGSFSKLSEWIYRETNSTWKISLERLWKLLFQYLTHAQGLSPKIVAQSLMKDITAVEGRVLPGWIRPHLPAGTNTKRIVSGNKKQGIGHNKRQVKGVTR